jgi:hypothetical protein
VKTRTSLAAALPQLDRAWRRMSAAAYMACMTELIEQGHVLPLR